MAGFTAWLSTVGLGLALLGPEPTPKSAPKSVTQSEPSADPIETETETETEAETEAETEPSIGMSDPFDVPDPTPRGRAELHFTAGRWDLAVEALLEARAADPQPAYLYALGQAERMRDRCGPAIAWYEQFLASDPPPPQRVDALRHVRACEQRLFEQQTEVHGPLPPVSAPLDADGVPVFETLAPAGPSVGRDPLGLSLLVTGSATTTAGMILWILGSRNERQATSAPVEETFEELSAQGRRRVAIGASLTGVGLGVIVGGVIRMALLSRKRSMSATAWGGPGEGGVALRGRF